MRAARIICIGKMKSSFFKGACAHYEKLLARMRAVQITELKDGSPDLDSAGRILQEGERIVSALQPRDWPVCLDQEGMQLSSPEFGDFLNNCDEKIIKRPAFIIGGPFGLAQGILDVCAMRLSLSKMTLPHELARVVLLEQLYRAECILRGHPYHH